ncbi:MAG: 50S ribosomal protein L25 [Candidatus Omnitrophica bacterium]|nr:50S ribosomal protein L25 [Candidatus Omnitrophota bacterium]
MEEIALDVQLRDKIGSRKVKEVYRENCVPAVVYGGEEKGSTPVKVDRRTYERIMRLHQGKSVIFRLNMMDGKKKLKDCSVIVKEEQHEPVSDGLVHIDFHRISLTEELEVKVPIVAKGEATGVKNDGGSLDHAIWELDVICLPTNIPDKILVDVTNLKIGDAIYVKDVVLPDGVRTEHDPEAILVSVVPPMKEVEIPVAGEKEEIEPEVIKEKKAEEVEEEGEKKAEAKVDEGKAKADEGKKKADEGKKKT